jgi:hypothetical protein
LRDRDPIIDCGEIGIEVHRREKAFAPDGHAGHIAVRDNHHPGDVKRNLLRVDAGEIGVSAGDLQTSMTSGCSIKPNNRVTREIPAPTSVNVARCLLSTRGTSVPTIETSRIRSCSTRLCWR